MEPISFPDFMSEENMRRMNRDELVDLFVKAGAMMMPTDGMVADPLTMPVHGERMEIPVRKGSIRVIVYRARKTPAPVYFDMHGGGFVAGNCEDMDFWCTKIRDKLDINVIAINYRKAPEYPWPTAPDDAFDAVSYFYNNAEKFGIDTDRMAIGGHSAGANLTAVTCLRSVLENAPFRFKLQVLDYPPMDLSKNAFDKKFYPEAIPPQIAMMFDACYIAPGEGNNPLVSPAVADIDMLRQQPPAVLVTAEIDSLCDEGELYGRKLVEAGIPVWSRRFLGSAHGFTMTYGGNAPGLPEDPNAGPALEMMEDALEYYLLK